MFARYKNYALAILTICVTAFVAFNVSHILIASFHSEEAIMNAEINTPYAFAEARKAFEMIPKDEDSVLLLGNLSEKLFFKTKNTDFLKLAVRCYSWAANLEPEQALNHYLLGIALTQINQPRFAEPQFDIAINLEPNNLVYLLRGKEVITTHAITPTMKNGKISQ